MGKNPKIGAQTNFRHRPCHLFADKMVTHSTRGSLEIRCMSMIDKLTLAVIVLMISISIPFSAGASDTQTDLIDHDLVINTDSEIAIRIDAHLSRIEAEGFSGAIVVTHEGRVILQKGYGFADRDTSVPYRPDTVQSHGSITKQMTGAAILLLEHHGRLDLDDSIDQYFDNVPADKQRITIHQLLTHASGLVGGIGPDREPIDAATYIDRLMQTALVSEPGQQYYYSNAGYALLGLIIEQVSGQSYEAFLREHLLLPAGLMETGYVLPNWADARLAVGYRDGERWGQIYQRGWLADGPGWHLRANGGLHTTVKDMRLWLKTLQGQGPLPIEAVNKWLTPYIEETGGQSHYGYGWAVRDTPWGQMINHRGSNGVFSAEFVWFPDQDLFFYIHGNSNDIPADAQRRFLIEAAFD